jgi:ubiquinone/menaquinone biosynthesis C-methylase UbiE
MTQPDRITEARRIASEASNDNPTGWFERLYAAAREGTAAVPWDRGAPNPLLVGWAREHALDGHGLTALVVGCGLGADAEHVASLGFATTAFDVSETATATARERFPDSRVDYTVADLLDPPAEWRERYDFVFESLTVQSLPPSFHGTAIANVTGFVASGGILLVIAGSREEGPWDGPPWPLTRDEVDAFVSDGLLIQQVEMVPSTDEPWARTWRVELRRAG